MLDITQWLAELGLDEYTSCFEANDIDADLLPELDHELLQQIGVASVGHRLRILKAVERLQPAALTLESRPPEEATTTPPTAQAERRQLTVMFVDLVGSTVLSRELDPEDLREINRAFQDAVKHHVEQFGGYVARYMGDGVLAYFGYPQAHENDAERAVHAGLALTEAIAALPPGGLSVRVGIATGPVVVGDLIGEGASQESAVVGETPNLASRLQGVAEPGTVVVSESTRALTGGAFTYEEFAPRVLKGFAEPVPVARVVEPRTDATRFEALRANTLSPLIGRDTELAMVCDRWQQAKAGDGQLVLVSGEAGIGKSRLVHAFHASLADDEPISMTFQCSPHHLRSPFFPVISGVDRAAGIAPSDDDHVRGDKLAAWLARVGREDDPFATLARVLVLAGGQSSDISARELHLQFLTSLINSPARPVVLLFEDMHWADPTTLEAASALMENLARDRVLVLMTARPEFEPPWAAPENSTLVSLGRLARNQRTALVAALGRRHVLSEALMQRIIDQTDGVPLFVEEVMQAVLTGAAAGVSGADSTVPATLHDSLLGRLDQLGDAKRVAQQAAVIGRDFSHALLAAAVKPLNMDVDAALTRLLASGLVLKRRGPDDDDFYSFKHALVRDAAYESLLRAHRREAHATMAAVFEADGAKESTVEQLAWHYEQAGEALNAATSWFKAATFARQRAASMEAAQLADSGIRALESVAPSAERDALEIELHLARGISTRLSIGLDAPEFRASLERVRALTEGSGHPHLTRTLFELSRLHSRNRDRAAWQEIFDAFTPYLDSGNVIDCMLAHTNAVSTHLFSEVPRAAHPHIRRLHQLLDENSPVSVADAQTDVQRYQLRPIRVAALSAICRSGRTLGNFDTALAMAAIALAEAEAAGPGAVTGTLTELGFLHLAVGDLDQAREVGARMVHLASRNRQPRFIPIGQSIVWVADALRGSQSATAQLLDAHLEGNTGNELIKSMVAYTLEALIQKEQWDRVDELVDRELPEVERLGWTAQLWPILSCKAHASGLRAPAGSEAEADAINELNRLSRLALDAGALVRALSSVTSMAGLLLRTGRVREAREALGQVYGSFSEGFDTPRLRETKAWIDELA